MQVQVVLVIRMYRVVSACAYACVREGDGDGDWARREEFGAPGA